MTINESKRRATIPSEAKARSLAEIGARASACYVKSVVDKMSLCA
jgi:hypothetical protein